MKNISERASSIDPIVILVVYAERFQPAPRLWRQVFEGLERCSSQYSEFEILPAIRKRNRDFEMFVRFRRSKSRGFEDERDSYWERSSSREPGRDEFGGVSLVQFYCGPKGWDTVGYLFPPSTHV